MAHPTSIGTCGSNCLSRRNIAIPKRPDLIADFCHRLLGYPAIAGALRPILPSLILLYGIPSVKAQTSGDEFSNNLFTDLAPLLALFGEQVVKQYLSQSTEWLEHVIFACGPLGIITAVISAIRVAGGSNLMAIIGRAREPRAQAEIELMSSTSSEVCELWNGLGIVRVNGSPDIVELVYDPTYINTAHPTATSDNFGIYTLSDMNKVPNPAGGRVYRWLSTLFRKRNLSPQEIPLYVPGNNRAAPNISLNAAGQHVPRWELISITLVGLILQVGIILFEGLATYTLRWQKGGQPVAGYAFPLTTVGTLAISAGMFISACVIEASTEETEYELCLGGKRLQMVWLQRAQNVSDQEFASYAIYAAKYQQRVMTSRLCPNGRRELERLTALGVAATTIGFVLQFIGLRAMHFSASLGNLIVAATMTVLRTVLRRGLTLAPDTSHTPSEKSYSIRKISEGHELDFVAKDIMACPNWGVVTHVNSRNTSAGTGVGTVARGVKVWQAKMRLSELAGLQWEGELHTLVDNVTETIQAIANYLWSPFGGITTSGSAARMKTLGWYMLVDAGPDAEVSRAKLTMTLTRENADVGGSWVAERKEIAATLCLWLSGFQDGSVDFSEKRKNLWLLGSSSENGDIGRILADWWISRENNRVEVEPNWSSLDTIYSEYGIGRNRVLDCVAATKVDTPQIRARFPDTHIVTLPAFITQTSLPQMCAQYLLSAFISSAASHIDQITSKTEINTVDDQRLLVITNDGVRGLAEKVQRLGLATMEDAYRIIVPALSRAHKLPDVADRILGMIECGGGEWPFKGEIRGGVMEARAEEFYRLIQSACTDEVNMLIGQNRWVEAGAICRRLMEAFSKRLKRTHLRSVVVRSVIDQLYKDLVSTDTEPISSLQAAYPARGISKYPLHDAVRTTQASEVYNAIQVENIEPNSFDEGGHAPLHLASIVGKTPLIKLLLFSGVDPHTTDPIESRTALHFITICANGNCTGERAEAAALLIQNGTDIDARDGNGNTALMLAATSGCNELVFLFADNGADLGARNGKGDSAVLLAANSGNEVVVEYLVKNKVDLNTPNENGDTALSLAAQIAHEKIVKELVKGGASMDPVLAAAKGYEVVLKLLIGDKSGGGIAREEVDKAFLSAAAGGHVKVVALLLDHGADENARSDSNDTALILAAMNGHRDAVGLLLDTGVGVDAVGADNKTALLATSGEHDKIIELLLAKGADPNSRDDSRSTALHWAALGGYEHIVELLLDHGADVNIRSDDSSTPLHSAASSGNEVVTRLILAKHPDVDAQDVNGDTPLLIATQGRHLAVASFLAASGADVNISNNETWTAIMWAVHLKDEPIKTLLLGHGAIIGP